MTATGFRQIPDTGIPTHVPLECTFQAQLCKQEGLRVRKPAPLPSGWALHGKDEEKAAAEAAITEVLDRSELLWSSCLEADDLDSAYSCLCADAESYVGLRSQGCERLPAQMRGRGHFRLQKHTLQAEHTCAEEGAVTTRCHRQQGLARKLEELVRKYHVRGEAACQQCLESATLWKNICHLAPSLMPHLSFQAQRMPAMVELLQLCADAREHVQQEQRKQAGIGGKPSGSGQITSSRQVAERFTILSVRTDLRASPF